MSSLARWVVAATARPAHGSNPGTTVPTSRGRETDIELPVLQVVSAPRSSNPNLNAQAGLFLAPSIYPSQLDKRADLAPMDERLARHTKPGALPVLWKLVMPSSFAGKALRLLSARAVNRATLFPGFAGAAGFLSERKKWDFPNARWTPWTPE